MLSEEYFIFCTMKKLILLMATSKKSFCHAALDVVSPNITRRCRNKFGMIGVVFRGCFILFIFNFFVLAQVENVPVVNNPVYDFLLQIETKGILPHYTLSQLPLQKKTIISALKLARENDFLLTNIEKKVLTKFEKEYQIVPNERAVAILTEVDTNSVFSNKIWKDYDKSFYHYADSNSNVTVIPLASAEYFIRSGGTLPPPENQLDTINTTSGLFMGTLGFRLSGTLSNQFGYYFQFTNSAVLDGDSSIAMIDNRYATSKQFSSYHHDADISESHIAYQNDWFYASIGRETRLFGAGLDQRLIINNAVSPTFDAITLKAKFKTFEYVFSHNSLLNFPNGNVGAFTTVPPKYTAKSNFIFLPSWGEISFFQSVIYARNLDLAYLNPLSFLKTLEVNLRERDNIDMGFTAVVRPIKNLQLKATWFLDDLKFSEIGNNYWGNKSAWNIAAITSAIPNINLGLEYTRAEPYTFSHFNPENSATTDSVLFCSTIQPNSDRITALLNFWWGQRYPIQVKYSHTRHGRNIYDNEGNLIKNVGGDALISRRYTDEIQDSYYVNFLDGDLNHSNKIDITAGYEIFRGLSFHFLFSNFKTNRYHNYYRILFRIYDF